jgi:DNA-binding beta-propeller fold protein YncE
VAAWGQTIGVEIDGDGFLWVFHRCFDSSCAGRPDVPPVLRYHADGRLVDAWGEGRFVWPHGTHLDRDGNLWTTDAGGREGIGHQVLKFAPDGTLLMTLGTAGVEGDGPDTFDGPADVAVAPNGDVFVADGHGNDRVVKFTSDGRYLAEWGGHGTEPGRFDEPHTLAFDSRGRLFVGDRVNERIQVFDQDGSLLAVWSGIMASGIHITADDVVYVADYQLREGIVIARAEDFREIGFVSNAMPEGVTVDRDGNVYAAEVLPRNLKKFERRAGGPG